jgi:hypothetical protein
MNQMTSAAIPSSASMAATTPTIRSFRNAAALAGSGFVMNGLQWDRGWPSHDRALSGEAGEQRERRNGCEGGESAAREYETVEVPLLRPHGCRQFPQTGRRRTGLLGLPSRQMGFQVFMIFRPALRFLTRPFPPGDLAARFLAAVIFPPLLFFAICQRPPSFLCVPQYYAAASPRHGVLILHFQISPSRAKRTA